MTVGLYDWWKHPIRLWFRPCRRKRLGWLLVPDWDWLVAQESLRRLKGNYKGMRRLLHKSGYHFYTTNPELKSVPPRPRGAFG